MPQKVHSIPNKVVKCASGKHSFCAFDEKGMIWIWGENKQGQLGLNDYTNRTTPYPLLALKDKQVNNVSLGSNYAIGYFTDVDNPLVSFGAQPSLALNNSPHFANLMKGPQVS